MTTRTAAEIAAIDHLITKLGKDIADATRVAESQEAAAETVKYSSRQGHEESAEFHRALAGVLAEVVELAERHFHDATEGA